MGDISADQLLARHHEEVRRAERFAWFVLGLVTAALVLMAATVVVLDYIGNLRVQQCREDLPEGGDAWMACSSRSSLRG